LPVQNAAPSSFEISLEGARALLLAAQGLLKPPKTATKAAVLECIRRMGVLQIDTINVVARSHLFVLWTRLGAYGPAWLDELLAEGKIFEYWAHAACFLPAEDLRLYRGAMLHRLAEAEEGGLRKRHPEPFSEVMERLREGSVRAADFERKDGKAGVWWNRKIEKWILEELYNTGEVMIARRERFQRVYDLIERVRPDWSDADLPTSAEIERELALRAVKALGVAPARWVADYFRRRKTGLPRLLETLVDAGELVRASIPELGSQPAYIHPDHLPLAQKAAKGRLRSEVTTLLSPFDPVVWHRARASELFDFDYRIEVYTPAAARKFGYFTLPILHRGRLVGRLCPKAHRKEGVFEIRQLHLEGGVEPTDELVTALGGALRACAEWHGTPQVVVREADTANLAEAVQSAAASR
jgi:uncharacterized protein YcaQ